MSNVEEPNKSFQEPYCPDRRTALEAFVLAAGGIALNLASPLPVEAKRVRVSRYRIIYNLNGGKQPAGQVKYVHRGKTLDVFQLKKPTRRGYKFSGWYADRRLTKKALQVYGKARKSKRTIYAKWRLKRYPIVYKMNGGVAKRKLPSSYTVESKRIVFSEPVKRGYLFEGWYADSKFKKRKSSIKEGSVGDVTVYARWKRAKYAIEYELNGGRATAELPKSYTIKSPEIKPIAPERDGWRFAGWYADEELTKPVASIQTGSVGDVKLYANWASIGYWDAHLQEKCNQINDIAEGIASSLPSLVFITDMHVPSNIMVSPQLVRKVMANTNTNMVVFGGDAVNNPVSKTDAARMLNCVRNAFGGAEVHLVRGNHDGNCQGLGASSDAKVTDQDFLSIAGHASETRNVGCIYCYRDDDEHKVRYIFLDSKEPLSHCVDPEQLGWLKNRVLELEEGWTVLVFVHQFYRYATSKSASYTTSGLLVREALDSVYDKARATIAGVISGHVHKDYAEQSKKGYPMISTTCDAYARGREPDYSYRLGTIAEQAFDVITLDTEQRQLYFTRIGRGKDRVFSYAPPQPIEEGWLDQDVSIDDQTVQEEPPEDEQADSGMLQAAAMDEVAIG